MFDLLKTTRRTPTAALAPGAIASVAAHAALLGGLLIERHVDAGAVKRWEAAVERLTYIAPPNVESVEQRTPLQYAPGGGAGFGPATATGSGTAGGPDRGSYRDTDRGAPVLELVGDPELDPFADAFLVVEVEEAAERDPTSAAPAYPPHLLAQGVEGYATMRFVVDTLGRVEPMSVRVLDSTHSGFVSAVKDAMPGMRFRPARRGDRAVRQLAEQQFVFRVLPRQTAQVP